MGRCARCGTEIEATGLETCEEFPDCETLGLGDFPAMPDPDPNDT